MKYDDIYEKLAIENNVDKEEILSQMQEAINIAMNDPMFKNEWKKISEGKRKVTPDDLIEYLASRVAEDLKI